MIGNGWKREQRERGCLDGWTDEWWDVTAGQDRAFILHCVLCIAAAEEVEEQAPSQPRLGELTASHVSPNSVQLEWSVPEGTFDSFTVQYIDVQGQAQELHLESGSRTVAVSGLLPSHPYKFNLYGLWGQTRLGPISTDTVTGEGPRMLHLSGP